MSISSKNYQLSNSLVWSAPLPEKDTMTNLVLIFGGKNLLEKVTSEYKLTEVFPNAIICGCSTAGEISDTEVTDEELVLTAICFEKTKLLAVSQELAADSDSKQLGSLLAKKLPLSNLRHVFVLSDGLAINGSALVSGLVQELPKDVAITGGLAGDGARFTSTLVYINGRFLERGVLAIGFYGNDLQVGYGSLGGWDPFGPERIITKSQDNVLFELDNRSALEIYKEYLGPYAEQLPASGLLFPLAIKLNNSNEPLVRTILAVNEQDQSITFAGDIPINMTARLMKANVERLVDGAEEAGTITRLGLGDKNSEFAILISCVGRKLVLKQRIEEEVEAAKINLGEQAILTGFYSYGEIAPFIKHARCELHNQTMTITAFRET